MALLNLIPIITRVGFQSLFDADRPGIGAQITHLVTGDTAWSPDANAVGLQSERYRFPVSHSVRLSPDRIRIQAVDQGPDDYWIRELGFLLADGTLLAVWSHPSQPLAFKSGGTDLQLALDLSLSVLAADRLVVSGVGSINRPAATEVNPGIIRLATSAEAVAGSAPDLALTPATDRAHGDGRYASLDHQHPWSQITNKPDVYPPAGHHHDERYQQPGLQVVWGLARLSSAHSVPDAPWPDGYEDTRYNYLDLYPPTGLTMANLVAVLPSYHHQTIGSDLNANHSIWIKAHILADRIRVVGNVSTNRFLSNGNGSYFNYLSIWQA